MVGYGPNKGLVPKLCERLFQAIRENLETRQCQVKSVCEWFGSSSFTSFYLCYDNSLFFNSTQVFFSMLEIYNEQVWEGNAIFPVVSFSLFFAKSTFFSVSLLSVQVLDLLSRGPRTPGGLRVREEQQRGFYVEGLRIVPCESAPQVQRRIGIGRSSYPYCYCLCGTVRVIWADSKLA